MIEIEEKFEEIIKKAKINDKAQIIYVQSVTGGHWGFILKFPKTKYLAFGVNGKTYCEAENSIEEALDFLTQRIFFEDCFLKEVKK